MLEQCQRVKKRYREVDGGLEEDVKLDTQDDADGMISTNEGKKN